MSILTVLTILLLFSTSVNAQIFAPNCSTTEWNWTFNSLNQNPCTVAAYLESVCNNGAATIDPLPPGWVYRGPSDRNLYGADLCLCNTVTYSLLSACGACQGNSWITWSEYVSDCTKALPPSTFPDRVPAGTRVPQWALLDVTLENEWDSNKSSTTGGSPEIGPGSFIGSPSSVITGPTTSPTTVVFPAATSDSSLLTSSLSGVGSPNTGAIVGGVIGGILIIAIAALGFFYLQRRRKTRRAPSAVFIDVDDEYGPPRFDGARMQLLRDEIHASLPMPEMAMPVTPMAFYSSTRNDSTTFPGQQGHPWARGYTGLPTV